MSDPFAPTEQGIPAVGRTEALTWLSRDDIGKLLRSGVLRLAAPKVYYRPHVQHTVFGSRLGQPSLESIAKAFATERGWKTALGVVAAQNALGLSTQVPACVVLAADGCRERMTVAKGRIIFEPAPAWVFGMNAACALLVQGTRCWQHDRGFRFPPGSDFGKKGRTLRQVAKSIAHRASLGFADGLNRDDLKLPKPYRRLARIITNEIYVREYADP